MGAVRFFPGAISTHATDKLFSKYLEQQSRAERTYHPAAMTTRDFWSLWEDVTLSQSVEALLILLAFALGQRLGDLAQVATEDIEWTQLGDLETLCITIRRGKVIPHIGPYTLHLPAESQLTQQLWEHTHIRLQSRKPFLFTHSNNESEKQKLERHARNILVSLNQDLEIRSVRRGGLEHMAKSGMPLGEIREHFSKHRSTEMLLGYLKWGSVSAHQAQIG